MDNDTESIGGIKNPMQPTRQLFAISIVMDVLSVLGSLFISPLFAFCILIYIICSRLYSFRGIRLKKYPVIGYLTVILNQGVLTFFMVYHGASANLTTNMPWQGLIASGFLIGGFYPITQIYQHDADRKDGVQTISMLLSKKGTFIFCSIMYTVALSLLLSYYVSIHKMNLFLILQLFFLPVLYFFLRWAWKVWQNEAMANFTYTMQMNWLASTCTSTAFITILILQQLG